MAWKNRSCLATIVVLLTVLVLGPGLAEAAPEKTPILISLDVRRMALQDVLRLIAKAHVNIIAAKEVVEADVVVTLRLKNVDLWQALKAVLEVSGFGYREEDGIIRVGKLKELVEERPPLITEIILLKYAKVEEAKKVCQHLLSPSGIIKMDIQTNALIINDISQNIERMRQVVTELDTKPPPVLERKQFQLNYIVDVAEKEEKDLLKDPLDNIIGEEGNFYSQSGTLLATGFARTISEQGESFTLDPGQIWEFTISYSSLARDVHPSLNILSWDLEIDSLGARIAGEAENNGDVLLSFVEITGTFYDAEEKELASGTVTTVRLGVGEIWQYAIFYPAANFEDIDDVKVEVTSTDYEPEPIQNVDHVTAEVGRLRGSTVMP